MSYGWLLTRRVLTERQAMINVTTRINAILESAIAKPPTRNRWSRRAIARYLGAQGLLGADKNTIAKWEVLLRVVRL